MDEDIHFDEHIELLSIIKDKLSKIPNELIEWKEGEMNNAQFIYLQYLKVVIDEESDKWINHYLV